MRRSLAPLLIVGLVALAVVIGTSGGSFFAAALHPGGSPGAVPTGSAAGATPSSAADATPSPSPTATPEPTPEPTPVLVPAPLTGLLVPPEATVRHPIAVMIDDHRGARPQSGFNAADVVWQAPAEGGIPRYMLVFQSRLPGRLGPIRSARQYFIEWAAEWRAMYVHIGGSGQALATLAAKGHGQLVYNADGLRFDGTDMFRVTDRAAPHNLYTDTQRLTAMAAIVGAVDGPVTPAWTFGDPLAADARPQGTTITVTYPYETIRYRYDAATNTYQRYIDGSATPQVDADDGLPVAPTNVVILRMRFGPLNDGQPQKHRLEAADVGGGEAIISTNGRVIRGTWKKAAIGAPTLLSLRGRGREPPPDRHPGQLATTVRRSDPPRGTQPEGRPSLATGLPIGGPCRRAPRPAAGPPRPAPRR
ncbi:MAG: DUF3048 domain-containing protein [Chloroflexi bacterium]|nr:DUF3048 domain-containing protein [Chloroflexota bacterium]